MNHNVRKRTFGHVRLTRTNQHAHPRRMISLRYPHEETFYLWQSKMRLAKFMIRQLDLSFFLWAHMSKGTFCYVAAHIFLFI